MVVPLLAAVEGSKAMQKTMDTPVIGWKTTTVKTTKKGVTTTEQSVQLRGWEMAGLGALGLVALWMLDNEGGQSKLGQEYGLAGDVYGDFMETISFGLLQKK